MNVDSIPQRSGNFGTVSLDLIDAAAAFILGAVEKLQEADSKSRDPHYLLTYLNIPVVPPYNTHANQVLRRQSFSSV